MEEKKKKPYVKPELVIELMELTESVTNCDVTSVNQGEPMVCAYISASGEHMFSATYVSVCKDSRSYAANQDDPYDNPDRGLLCWFKGGSGVNIFTS